MSRRSVWLFFHVVSDLGLLCAKKDLVANDVLYMVEELNDFKGSMAENYVHAQLMSNGYRMYYWESARGAEVAVRGLGNDCKDDTSETYVNHSL